MGWPLKFTLVSRDEDKRTGLGVVPGETTWHKVFSHEVVKSVPGDTGQFLVFLDERLEIICPPGTFPPYSEGERIVWIPGESSQGYAIEGNAIDPNNNPYWAPGLVTYYAQRVAEDIPEDWKNGL